jgi:hypothetical protein
VGLAETKKFAEGYDAIFGKKKEAKGSAAGKNKPAAKAGKGAKAKAVKPAARKKAAKGKKKAGG